MRANFLAHYKDSSDSSDSDDTLPRTPFRLSLSPSVADPSPVGQPRMAATPVDDCSNTIAPYTFDPKSVLDGAAFNIERKDAAGKGWCVCKLIGKHEEKLGITDKAGSKGVLKSSLKSGKKRSTKRGVSFNFAADDPLECRRTDEYKRFLRLFDKDSEASQLALRRLSDRMAICAKRLETVAKELDAGHLDLSLLRKHLQSEVGSAKNDIKEANNEILVLSEERKSLRDKYCVLQARNEFLKNPKKPLQNELSP
eukprot:TRINITY_DN2929_c0_g1_i1.p2 TRINITY_DN2929_c0_g1~~TRINITY_DN2929_c0_g1_i1.p2  ORF type:complete len:254 (-),score=51.70 TRINITY_DN2929_c0_g1_i1:1187-1948(-)